ncbi:MAG: PepSY domain-containing protein [Candidatus Heimdallarchaeota archaeon]|nr:PepSY domain-containing protein [Candidatus Heimdallarchaeota archaeon]
MKDKTILLTLTILLIFFSSIILLYSSGVVPLPFEVMPDEEGNHDGDHQYPNYEGSIAVSEDQETTLESLTAVSQAEAETSALVYTTGGLVVSSELENENGYLVWKVTVNFEGTNFEVVVDAGTATVLWASSD